jgi:hypothetical protein
LGALAILAVIASTATADDWLMFRKNTARTAASTDVIGLPLKPLWDWKSKRVLDCSVISTVVVRGDAVYFISGPPSASSSKTMTRFLVCADAKTGKPRWSRELDNRRPNPDVPEDIGPAISQGGTIFVVDPWAIMNPCPKPTYIIKAFSPKGELIATRVIPLKQDLSRYFMRSGVERDFLLTPTSKPVS